MTAEEARAICVEAEQLARAIAAIASERDALRAEVERLRAVEAESAAMREALPSILDSHRKWLMASERAGETQAYIEQQGESPWPFRGSGPEATERRLADQLAKAEDLYLIFRRAVGGFGSRGPTLLDRLAAAEAERDALRAELTLVMTECARLRSDVDVEREQSAAFVKDIERLRVVEAGAAIMRRVLNEVGRYAEWASTVREALRDGAGKDFLIQLVSAECDLARARQELEFDRKYAEQALDAASAEKERLRAEIEKERAEVKRLRARRPVLCTRCYGGDGWRHCGACGGSGAVIVEGEK